MKRERRLRDMLLCENSQPHVAVVGHNCSRSSQQNGNQEDQSVHSWNSQSVDIYRW